MKRTLQSKEETGTQSYTIMLLTDPSGTVQKEAHPCRKGGEASTPTGELNATAHFGPLVSLRAPKAKRRHVLLLRQRLLPHRPHRVVLPCARGFRRALHKLVLQKGFRVFGFHAKGSFIKESGTQVILPYFRSHCAAQRVSFALHGLHDQVFKGRDEKRREEPAELALPQSPEPFVSSSPRHVLQKYENVLQGTGRR